MKAVRTLAQAGRDAALLAVFHMPGPTGQKLRQRYWKRRLRHLGRNVRIDPGVQIQNPGFVTLEDDAWLDRNVIILAGPPGANRRTFVKENPDFEHERGEVVVGRAVHVAPNCVLSGIGGLSIGACSGIAAGSAVYSFSHHYRDLRDPTDATQYCFSPRARADQQAMLLGPVVLGPYVAVGLGAVILPGSTLGEGSWVASGAVVSGRFEAQSLIRSGFSAQATRIENLLIRT